MSAIPHPGHIAAPHAGAHDHAASHGHHEELTFVRKYIYSGDHKIIGLQFLFLGLIFFVIGGLLAMLVRWQLAWPTTELQEKHPVPILSMLLWSKLDPGTELGAIAAVDPVAMTVTVRDLGRYVLHVGDSVSWTIASGKGTGQVKVFDGGEAIIQYTKETVAPAVGDMVLGKRIPGQMPATDYTMFFSMHATIMIFFVIIPLLVGTFGNYLIPLKIGAADMAFPFLNGLAFWSGFAAGSIMLVGFFLPGNAAAAGWTSYPPLSALWQGAKSVAYTAPTDMWGSFIDFLRIGSAATGKQGTWPAGPLVINFIVMSLALGYLFNWYIKTGNRTRDIIIMWVLSLVGGYYLLRGLQWAAFDGQSIWFLSLFLLGFSSIMGAVNYLATIIKLRCPGMTMFRLPLSVWALFITSILVLLATPVLASTLMMNLLDHHRITSFFLPSGWFDQSVGNVGLGTNSGGGFALLHQHLFWFYSHPAVYIMILPAMGMVSDVISVFARKPIFGYRPMVYAIAGIAFLGFIVWAHHMFQSGMNPTLGTTFAVSTMFIAVPSAIKTFNWLGTLWGGNIRFTTAMWNALAFVAMFVIGGLSGVFMASTAVDVHIHDTYFIVAHIHYVLFGGSMFGIFAGIYFWYPKMFGRMMNETLGKIHFFLTFITFNLVFFAMHILGIGGFPRRIADYMHYTTFAHFQPMNEFITWSAFALGIAQIFFAINFIGSWIWGKRAPNNPWEATTLEWNDTTSPPPHGNFTKVPVVHHGPYEYSSPLVEEDWLAQTRWVEGAEKLASAKH